MIDHERTITDGNARLQAVLAIERYHADRMYVVPSAGPYQYVLLNPRVQNYEYSSSLGKMTETYAKLWLKQ